MRRSLHASGGPDGLVGGLLALALGVLPGVARAQDLAETHVRVVSEPWSAPCQPADLAAAVRLRLGDGAVEVATDATPDAPAFLVRSLDGADRGLRVERAGQSVADIPLAPEQPEQACRRAAVVIAMLAGPEPSMPPDPARVPAPAPAPAPSRPAAAAGARRATRAEAAPTQASWSVGGGIGAAVAAEAGKGATVLALQARWFFAGGAGLQVGVKLAGGFEEQAPALRATVSDRALWLGASYRTWWAPVGLDVGLALQYTLPVVDVDGLAEAGVSDASRASRVGLRASADALWSLQRHLALTLGVGVTASFEEREFARDGQDFIELGTTTIDLLGGAEVMW